VRPRRGPLGARIFTPPGRIWATKRGGGGKGGGGFVVWVRCDSRQLGMLSGNCEMKPVASYRDGGFVRVFDFELREKIKRKVFGRSTETFFV